MLIPTWAPDGTALVFRSKVNGTVSDNSLYKTVLSTGAVTLLYSGGVTPDWAP